MPHRNILVQHTVYINIGSETILLKSTQKLVLELLLNFKDLMKHVGLSYWEQIHAD